MTLQRVYGLYTIFGLEQDMVYGSHFTVHVVLKVLPSYIPALCFHDCTRRSRMRKRCKSFDGSLPNTARQSCARRVALALGSLSVLLDIH